MSKIKLSDVLPCLHPSVRKKKKKSQVLPFTFVQNESNPWSQWIGPKVRQTETLEISHYKSSAETVICLDEKRAPVLEPSDSLLGEQE